ncbi:MAG: hypothetical protein HYS89_00965 [Candidatus Colwellbacteria bacterium]|nr:hypothetical protein [Candidatus Colwellbacteria bacterium]
MLLQETAAELPVVTELGLQLIEQVGRGEVTVTVSESEPDPTALEQVRV